MKNNFLLRSWIYQSERFPIIILTLTTLSVILSSAKIVQAPTIGINIGVAFWVAIFYLFHIRVIDEYRDHSHDNLYHQNRPIQTGLISLKELLLLDTFGILFILGFGLIYGLITFIISLILLLYSFLASRDFFLGTIIRRHFFIYNVINLFQLVILQFLIYKILSPQPIFNYDILILHLTFVFMNSVLIEWARKIKIKPEESLGHDTYSARLGFKKSLNIYTVLLSANYLIFFGLVYLISPNNYIAQILSSAFFISLLTSIVWHFKKQGMYSEKVFLLNTLIFYIGLNLIIYFM